LHEKDQVRAIDEAALRRSAEKEHEPNHEQLRGQERVAQQFWGAERYVF